MQDCIFCKIIKGEVPCYKVYEDENTLAFLDINQSAPGHTMVIPKKHGLTMLDYEDEELGNWIVAVKRVNKKILKAMKCNSMTLGINQFEIEGVPHLHIHLIPRWPGDGGGIIQATVNNPPKESLEKIAGKIRKTV